MSHIFILRSQQTIWIFGVHVAKKSNCGYATKPATILCNKGKLIVNSCFCWCRIESTLYAWTQRNETKAWDVQQLWLHQRREMHRIMPTTKKETSIENNTFRFRCISWPTLPSMLLSLSMHTKWLYNSQGDCWHRLCYNRTNQIFYYIFTADGNT